jgi:hypothetical protein
MANKTGRKESVEYNTRYISLFVSILVVISCFYGCMKKETVPLNQAHRDDDGMLIIDGARTFVIGAYHLPKAEEPYRALKENGYNLIHVDANLKDLDAAHQYQLKTWISTGYIKDNNREEDQKRIAGVISEFKSHPALLCWEIADEPAFTWNSAELRIQPEPMLETYRLIKNIDPEHLVYTNHGPVNLVSTLQKYNLSTDIVACDVYPVIPHGIMPTYALFADGLQGDLLNPYISQVGEYTDKMQRVVDHLKPVFMVLQGFSWEMLKEEKERNTGMILYPSYEQSRFMAFDAIIHGAVGLNYWGMSYTPQPSDFMNDLNRVAREMADLQPVLSARETKINLEMVYHELGHSIDSGVELLSKQVDGIKYLITANADKNPVRVSFRGLSTFKSAKVLNENRSVSIQSGSLTDDYKPFDVHIYELE